MSKKHVIGVIALLVVALGAGIFFLVRSCSGSRGAEEATASSGTTAVVDTVPPAEPPFAAIAVPRDIPVAAYFDYMDSLVARYDTLTPYPLSEHLIVRANPWIIDTLENTDYYRRMARGEFVYDQRAMTVLKAGDTLRLPGPQRAAALLAAIRSTRLDINIPAFRLQIIEGDSTLYAFPVRVGKNKRKYLAMTGRVTDLRTLTGSGEIVRINRHPVFYDPVTGKTFEYTKRDDKKTTFMPQIPWMEPALDGRRYGQMIHPTTNPATLGKPASNGCIGTREADAWRIYYYAPVGTKVTVRYELTEISPAGDTLRYKDIYKYLKTGGKPKNYAGTASMPVAAPNICWCL